ncbi:hypothetical protein [Asticcacaulis sp. EMRT-3]|uniref:hypothetical protein n=1 Tax=Asticcacaulis sp. EMRT-3 TaxID=3040349 RepID=UPI0024AE92E8|nr:hypothetical protein [Asticcacaulis sp. EMRT-3]MDI7773868.1 hypothetical protein [Asticcacaulis sp. EMRT-3]
MEFGELLLLVRDSYISQFAAFIDQQNASHIGGAPEVKFELSEDSEIFGHIYCADYASEEDGGHVVELAPDEEISFDPLEVSFGAMEIAVTRLAWHDMTISIGQGGHVAPEALAPWFETWFDPDEQRFDPDTRFSGNIHALTLDRDGLNVDFGTAPMDAFVELIDLLEEQGCKAVAIS